MYLPLGDAANVVPLVSAEDVARAATAALTDPPRHRGKVYPIVGQAATPGDIAMLLSQVLGRPVEHVDVSDGCWREMATAREGNDNPLQIEHLSKLWLTVKLANQQGRDFDPRAVQALYGLLAEKPKALERFLYENTSVFAAVTPPA